MTPSPLDTPPGRGLLQSAAFALLVFVLGLVLVAPAEGQDDPGLSFLGGAAYEWGGPGPRLTQEMAELGLDQEKPEECFGTVCIYGIDYPFYFDEGLNIAGLLGLRYRFESPISIQVVVSNSLRGQAEGNNEDRNDHLVITYASFLLTPTLGVHVGPLRLGVGPVLNRSNWGLSRTTGRYASGSTTTVGGVLSASVGLRLRDVRVDAKGGVRQYPPVDLGEALQVELSPTYQTYFLGVTITPLLY